MNFQSATRGLMLIALLGLLSTVPGTVRGQTATIGANQYAFQYQPGASATLIGLYFNTSASRYEFRNLAGDPVLWIAPQDEESNFTGRLGINNNNPIRDLHIIGNARIGAASNYFEIDVSGNLRFGGSAQYLVAPDAYAFKSDGATNGLFFNQSGNKYEFIDNAGSVSFAIGANGIDAGKLFVSNVASFSAGIGINTSTPSADFQVIGDVQLGTGANYTRVDLAGNLRFVGTAEYLVENDKYAFRSSLSSAGLLFNVTANQYQFINIAGSAVFTIEATGSGSGNTIIEGTLNVADELHINTTGNSARIDANSGSTSYLSAIRGEGVNDNTFGYLGVQGKDTYDGTTLDIAGDEIGVLGIAISGLSGTTDDYGVVGYSDHVGIRAEHQNGNIVELATDIAALVVDGNTLMQGQLDVDSIEVNMHLVIDNNADITISENGPLVVGVETGARMSFSKSAIQTQNSISFSALDINPLGGNVNIGDGGGNVNLASLGSGGVNIGLGGGVVNINSILHSDPANERIGILDVSPAYTFVVKHSNGTLDNGFALINGLTNTTWQFYSFIDGDLGLFLDGTQKGFFDNVTGMYMVTSDRRAKTSIRNLSTVSEKLNAVQPRKYKYKNFEGARDSYGFVAQEVAEIFPDLVEYNKETDLMGVSYMEFVPLLVAGFQEQQETINSHQEALEEIDGLRDQLLEAINRIGALESDLSSCCISSRITPVQDGELERASLGQNIPNPFTNSTLISYYLPGNSINGQIVITDINGKTIQVFDLENKGYGELEFSNSSLSAGTYPYTLLLNGEAISSKQMVIQ